MNDTEDESNWSNFQFSLKGLMLTVTLLALPLGVIGWVVDWHRGVAHFKSLLAGDEEIAITRLKITSQQRRLVCTDPKVLAYFASQLRQRQPVPDVGSWTSYYATFDLSTGRDIGMLFSLGDNHFKLKVPDGILLPSEHDTDYIVLSEPIPQRVCQIWAFLDSPYREVAGLSLYVEAQQPFRYEYVRSLHSEPRGSRVSELV